MIILVIFGSGLLIVVGLFIWYHLSLRKVANKLIEAMIRRDINELEQISKSKYLPSYTKLAVNCYVDSSRLMDKKKNEKH